MKHPWITFTGICALVMGIVMFCVVFGGYSSLVRSKNRINTVKQLLTEQCAGQVKLAGRLADLTRPGDSSGLAQELVQKSRELNVALIRMAASRDPLEPELVEDFQTAQSDVSRLMEALMATLRQGEAASDHPLEAMAREQAELQTSVLVMIRQYNKEARYFNSRSHQFPGVYIAKLFSLDHLRFPEILFPSPVQAEATSAS